MTHSSCKINSNSFSVNWDITGGVLLLPNPTSPGIMNVAFNDVPGGAATLRATYTSCSNAAANGQSQVLTVFIRSITNLPLGALTLNGSTTGSIEFGSTAPVTLEVPQLIIPRNSAEPNPVTIVAPGFEWTIPSGWTWPDGAISNGAPRLFNNRSVSTPNRIVVTPPATACAGGVAPVVRVQAVDTECSIGALPGYQPTRSAVRTLTVNCLVPQPVIISNRTPQGGAITLFCGESLTDQQVRVGTTNVPSGGEFSNYAFSVGGVVRSFCCLNTATPGLNVAGVGTGTIGLSATYTRNGASAAVVAATVAVTLRSEVAPVTLQPIPTSCQGTTVRLQVAPVPGATSYAWTVPNPFSPAGVTVTPAAQPYLDITSDPAAPNRVFTVGVEARSGNCTPSTDTKTGILGSSVEVAIETDLPRTSTEVCANRYEALVANFYNPSLTYDWTITVRSGGVTLSSYLDYGGTVWVTTPPAGQWLDVVLRVTTPCGNFLPAYASWQSVERFQSGEYCLTVNRPQAATPAYPNPADGQLTAEQGGGAAVLRNAYGQPVHSSTAKPGRLRLDTSRLPVGLYFLETRDAEGNPTRQQIRIEH